MKLASIQVGKPKLVVMERTVGAEEFPEDFSESPLMLDDFVFGC